MNNLNLYEIGKLLNETITDIVNPPEGIQLSDWSEFNEFTGGLRPHEFTIFCGATGLGKTQWLANVIASLITQNVKTFSAPVETGAVDMMRRILSIYGGYDFNTGTKPEVALVDKLRKTLSSNFENIEKNLYITTYDNRVDVNELIQNLQYLSEVHQVKVAVLDNLNFFMRPTRAQDTILEYDEVVHNFVMLAKKIPMHIILVMHPKKTEGGKVISEFDIKGSSTAVQEATNVLLMNRVDEKDQENGLTPFDREFVFRKIRRRGFYVGRKFYMRSVSGKYIPTPRDNQTPKSNGIPIIKRSQGRPESFFGND